jgi:hypothetical protein
MAALFFGSPTPSAGISNSFFFAGFERRPAS